MVSNLIAQCALMKRIRNCELLKFKNCAFILQVPEAFQNLIDKVESTMRFSIEVEEGIPMDQVTNFKDV